MSKGSKSSPVQLRGKVLSFNLTPKGYVEGAMLETSAGLAQVYYPKPDADGLAHAFPVGSGMDIQAELESDKGDHAVYKIGEEESETTGVVARFNYAPRGEINGYHLDNAMYLHVKPEGAAKFRVRVDEKIKA